MKKRHNLLKKLLISSFLVLAATPASAQLTPDNTLGQEASTVNNNTLVKGGNADLINGGAQRGSNLFHSFTEFNINNGQRVYFANPSGVQNILTRVTGGNASNILGTLGVNGAANLFIINPNGILLGQNASLDIQGSFVGTTANAVKFGNQGIFSATNPEAAPLLTIQPSALLFNQLNQQASITNKSQAAAGVNLIGENVTGLRVPDGKSLLLVGGNVNIDGSGVRAYGGNIELAGLAAPGSVGLNIAGDNLSLVMPDVDRANVSLTNGAEVNVRGNNGGNININARNLDVTEGSKIRAGIDKGLGTLNSQGGNIVVNATGTITLSDNSIIANVLQKDGFGQSGNINISTGSLNLKNNSFIDVTTFGNGNAGNAVIQAKDNINLIRDSGIYSSVETGAVGNGGSIQIQTSSLSLFEGAEINTRTYGQGSAGSITINARDAITLDGKGENIFSRIISGVNPEAIGNTGDIQLTTNTLKLTNGAFIANTSFGKGNGGNITIDARDIALDSRSFVSSSIHNQAEGNAGNIQVNTETLSLQGGSRLSTTTSGKGDAGNITISARDSIKLDGIGPYEMYGVSGYIGSSIQSDVIAGGIGNAGNISIKAADSVFLRNAVVTSSVVKEGIGNGGSIDIATGTLTLTDNTILSTSISGKGRAGDVSINANGNLLINNGALIITITDGQGSAGKISIRTLGDMTISGRGETIVSAISTSILNTGVGNGGDIEINARNFTLSNGAILTSITAGKGNAGSVIINTVDSTTIKDGSISAFTNGQGNAGKVVIRAGGDVSIIDKSYINNTVAPSATGDGGDIEISASNLLVSDGANLFTATLDKGNAGSLRIDTTGDITMKNASSINASTLGEGDAGNVTVNAGNTLFISGATNDGIIFDSSISTTVAQDAGFIGKGKSGNINVTARNLSLNSAGLSVSSFGDSAAGDININSGTVRLDNKSIIAAATTSGNGGNINLTAADFFLLRNNSNITTTGGFDNQSAGDGGNITINTPFIIAVSNEDSNIAANAYTGKGGNVNIRARSIFGIEAQSQSTSKSDITASSQLGVQGQISITQPDVDATQAIIELPNQVVDASNQIGQICPRGAYAERQEGEFIVTGRGSLPLNPLEMLPGTHTLTTLATLDGDEISAKQQRQVSKSELDKNKVEITEAQGLLKNADGSVELVAMAPFVTPSSNGAVSSCPS